MYCRNALVCGELDFTHYENLVNLHLLINRGRFKFVGLPLKIRGGTGSPVRAVAIFEHDSGADFAVWCTYKYLNSGPGSLGGVFVHSRHLNDQTLPKFAGWWGQNKERRFLMEDEFDPIPSVESWQLSNAPILSFAPMLSSLELFHNAGIENLRNKSISLTGFLEELLNDLNHPAIEVITPNNPQQRGCQLSIKIKDGNKNIYHKIRESGVILDWREPNVIRAAPAPLYNNYSDVFEFVLALRNILGAQLT